MTRMTLIAALGALTVLGACVEDDDKVDQKPVVVVPPATAPAAQVAKGKGPVVVDGSATAPGAGTVVVVPPVATKGQTAPGGTRPVVVAP